MRKLTLMGLLCVLGFCSLAGDCDEGSDGDGDADTDGDGDGDSDGCESTTPVSSVEPNDDYDHAQDIELCQVLTDTFVGGSDEQDWVRFTLPEGQVDGWLVLTLADPDDTGHAGMQLCTTEDPPNCTVPLDYLTDWVDTAVSPYIGRYQATEGTTYVVQTWMAGVAAGTESLDFTFVAEWITVPDEYEPNNTFEEAKPMELGTTFDLVLFSGCDRDGPAGQCNDQDFFTVEVPEGATQLRVQSDNQSTEEAQLDLGVVVYDMDQQELDRDGSGFMQDLDVTLDVGGPGQYFVEFYAANQSPFDQPNPTTISAQ